MVYRVYVEKKPELANEARDLRREVRHILQIKSLEAVRIINRYDVENIEEELFQYAVRTVFSEPQLDLVSDRLDPEDAGFLPWNSCRGSLISGRIPRRNAFR